MPQLSIFTVASVWIITLNSFGINLVVLFKHLYGKIIDDNKYISETQMEKMLKKDIIRVAIYRNKAYWVLNNFIYKAEIDEYGNIMNDKAEEIDVFKLSEREVNNLLTILDSMND